MIRVLVVDDHELVRTGICRLLDDRSKKEGIAVVDEAESGEAAVDKVRELRPDVVLMDVNMPGIGGMEAMRRMLQFDPDIKVIVVTVHADGPFPKRLLEAGAAGYLTKGCPVDEMVSAIKEARGIVDAVAKKHSDISVRDVKKKIQELKARKAEANANKNKAEAKTLRRRINRLKKKTRKAA